MLKQIVKIYNSIIVIIYYRVIGIYSDIINSKGLIVIEDIKEDRY